MIKERFVDRLKNWLEHYPLFLAYLLKEENIQNMGPFSCTSTLDLGSEIFLSYREEIDNKIMKNQ